MADPTVASISDPDGQIAGPSIPNPQASEGGQEISENDEATAMTEEQDLWSLRTPSPPDSLGRELEEWERHVHHPELYSGAVKVYWEAELDTVAYEESEEVYKRHAVSPLDYLCSALKKLPQGRVFNEYWALDFNDIFVPENLYSIRNTTVNTCKGDDRDGRIKGAKNVINLVNLSDRVRTLVESGHGKKAARHIESALLKSWAWAIKDGDLERINPTWHTTRIENVSLIDENVVMVPNADGVLEAPDTPALRRNTRVIKRHLERLTQDAGRMGDHLFIQPIETDHPSLPKYVFKGIGVPIMYLWIIIDQVVKVLFIDPKDKARRVRELLEIDFSVPDMSLWNAIRVAAVMCTARTEMLKVKRELPVDEDYEDRMRAEAEEDE